MDFLSMIVLFILLLGLTLSAAFASFGDPGDRPIVFWFVGIPLTLFFTMLAALGT